MESCRTAATVTACLGLILGGCAETDDVMHIVGPGDPPEIDPDQTLERLRQLRQTFYWSKKLGSWKQSIKTSESTDPWHDDMPATVQALEETGQNFYIYFVESEVDWLNFLELLEAAKCTDLEVFAATDRPKNWVEKNIWFDETDFGSWTDSTKGQTPEDCDCTGYSDYLDRYQCDVVCIEAWLEAWKNAAAFLSELSLKYPNLVGFVIDDFGGFVESADYPSCLFGDRLSAAQVGEIQTAAHSVNKDFEFWPTMYYTNFGRTIGEGYILGANYGVRLIEPEEMSVTLSFDVTDTPSRAYLRFFHNDTIGDCEIYHVYKRVEVNGHSMSQSVAGNQMVEYFRHDIAGLLQSGENTIRLVLDPEELWDDDDLGQVHNGCESMFWRIWDVSLELWSLKWVGIYPSYTVKNATFTESYNTSPYGSWTGGCSGAGFGDGTISTSDSRGYFADCDTLLASLDGLQAGRLIAAPNRDYLIHDVVDGIVAPWYMPDEVAFTVTPCSNGTAWPFSVDLEIYYAVLQATKSHLNGKKLMALHRGMKTVNDSVSLEGLEDDHDTDLNILSQQIEIASSVADYTGLWNAPIGLHFVEDQLGVFAWHPPEGASKGDPYTFNGAEYGLMAYWPGRQSRLSGWYQRWVSTDALAADYAGGIITISVADTVDAGSTGALIKSIYARSSAYPEDDSIGYAYYEKDVAQHDSTVVDSLTIPVGSEPIVLSVELVGVAASDAKVYFSVTDASGFNLTGDPLTKYKYWKFESGVRDKDVVETYEVERDTYLNIREDSVPFLFR